MIMQEKEPGTYEKRRGEGNENEGKAKKQR